MTATQKHIVKAVLRMRDISRDTTAFPSVSPLSYQVLYLLSEEAVKTSGGSALTASEIAHKLKRSTERINDNLNRLAALVGFYCTDLGVTIARVPIGNSNRKQQAYRITLL